MGGKILKIPSLSHAQKSGRGRGLTSKLLKVVFPSKVLILSTGLPLRRLLAEIAVSWRYRLPINNLTPH